MIVKKATLIVLNAVLFYNIFFASDTPKTPIRKTGKSYLIPDGIKTLERVFGEENNYSLWMSIFKQDKQPNQLVESVLLPNKLTESIILISKNNQNITSAKEKRKERAYKVKSIQSLEDVFGN